MPALRSERAYFIFGAKSSPPAAGANSKPSTRHFNRPKDGFSALSQQKLLAFGEYLPFRKMLSWIPACLLPMVHSGPRAITFPIARGIRIAPSSAMKTLPVSRAGSSVRPAPYFGQSYERRWYGKSVGPGSTCVLAQSRAIENRRSLLRVTNRLILGQRQGELVKFAVFSATVLQAKSKVERTTICPFWRLVCVGARSNLCPLRVHLKRYLAPETQSCGRLPSCARRSCDHHSVAPGVIDVHRADGGRFADKNHILPWCGELARLLRGR